MSQLARIALLIAAASASVLGFEAARESIGEAGIRGHLYFLSHDDLAGRAPGTRGGDVAARYIASRFLSMGLEPVGGGGYYQTVPMVGMTVDSASVSLAFETEGSRLPAEYGREAVVWAGTAAGSVQLSGELVFVGYGVVAPEWDWDDFKGRDVRGKVVLVLVGDPPAPPDEPELFEGRALTYYGRWTYKIEEARRRGAAGVLLVHDAETAGYPWTVVQSSWTGEQFSLPTSRPANTARLQGWLAEEFARGLVAEAGLDLDELHVLAARRDFRPVATGLLAHARIDSRVRRLETRNVVGLLPGAHPQRRNEVVVLTSHYDHLGIGPAVDGDSIYNGAYDNAGGVGVLLEVARAFTLLEEPPDRGLLFLATTAEEAGLLGAEHYVANPLVPLRRTIAALNVDGANLWGETDDMIVLGADRSTLGDLIGSRADELGLVVRGDPVPQQGSFFRSDHFPFARAGVPVLYIEHGLRFRGRPDGWGERTLAEYQARRYHRPSDEYDPAFDLSGAVQQGRLLFSVAYDIANAEQRPEWYEGEAPAARNATPR